MINLLYFYNMSTNRLPFSFEMVGFGYLSSQGNLHNAIGLHYDATPKILILKDFRKCLTGKAQIKGQCYSIKKSKSEQVLTIQSQFSPLCVSYYLGDMQLYILVFRGVEQEEQSRVLCQVCCAEVKCSSWVPVIHKFWRTSSDTDFQLFLNETQKVN